MRFDLMKIYICNYFSNGSAPEAEPSKVMKKFQKLNVD